MLDIHDEKAYHISVWSKTLYPGIVFFNTRGLTTSYRCIKSAVFAHLLFPDVFDQTPPASDENGIFDFGRFMATSKLQNETKERLLALFTGFRVLENFRPIWLTNEKTGYPLEIDLYLPDFKIGVEIQGRQHVEYTPYFHRTETEFQAQLERDALKKELCLINQIQLFEIFKDADIDTFIDNLHALNNNLWKELSDRNTEIKSLPYLAARMFEDIHKCGKDSARIKSLLRRITTIANKYGIPTQSIKPDFTIRKIEMAYTGKDIIQMIWPEDGTHSEKHIRAALITVDGNIGKISYFRKRKQLTHEFDLSTGKSIDGSSWYLNMNTIPKDLSKYIQDNEAYL